MKRMIWLPTAAALLLAATSLPMGSAGLVSAAAAQRLPRGVPATALLLLRHDANHDGIVTKDEVEAGLKADFADADSDHDNCLNAAEVSVENEQRLERDGAQASPLKDWNLDGCVDMREFGNTVHSYFDLADRSRDGRVSQVELRGSSMPIAPPGSDRRPPPRRTATPAPASAGY